jgi:hypothetical protein|tara:strand:- start:54 stop:668 length:615 start_codon:yes stop_codon:yes gene_type:complete
MANIKFSDFTSEAVDATETRIVGYVNGTTKNTRYTIAQIATGLASSLPTIYSADSSLAAARTVTMGTYNLAFASSTAGQEVSFGQNVKISGQAFSNGVHTITASGANIPIDWDNGNVQVIELAGSGPYTLQNSTNLEVGATYILIVKQDGSGSRLINTYESQYEFPGATAPTLTTGAGKADIITMIAYNANTLMCSSTLDFTIN